MIVRHVCGTSAAALLTVSMAAFAQTSQPTPSSAQARSDSQSGSPITLVGCIQREADYRRANDSGRGGVAATGVGLGNEFVLVNAATAGTGSTANTGADCSGATGGEAYELTGPAERDLERYVGQRVELSGMLKRADTNTAVGTSGAPTPSARPSGGFDPLGQDLRLHEVEISSVKEFAAAAAPAAAAPAPAAVAPEPAPQAETPAPRQPERTETVSPQIELPRTASPIPLAGLAGLLSLCGAAGIRAYRRRR